MEVSVNVPPDLVDLDATYALEQSIRHRQCVMGSRLHISQLHSMGDGIVWLISSYDESLNDVLCFDGRACQKGKE